MRHQKNNNADTKSILLAGAVGAIESFNQHQLPHDEFALLDDFLKKIEVIKTQLNAFKESKKVLLISKKEAQVFQIYLAGISSESLDLNMMNESAMDAEQQKIAKKVNALTVVRQLLIRSKMESLFFEDAMEILEKIGNRQECKEAMTLLKKNAHQFQSRHGSINFEFTPNMATCLPAKHPITLVARVNGGVDDIRGSVYLNVVTCPKEFSILNKIGMIEAFINSQETREILLTCQIQKCNVEVTLRAPSIPIPNLNIKKPFEILSLAVLSAKPVTSVINP
jgi:hypothetical protein